MGIRRSQVGRGDIARDANWLRPFLPAIGGDTYRVRVSENDTTPDYLDAKITSADGSVVITVLNDGADEGLDLSVAVYVAAEIATHASDPDAHHDPVTQGYGIVVTGQQVAIDTSVIAEVTDLHSAVTLSTAANSNLLSLSGQQIGLDNQSANIVFAGPSSGGAAAPAFRALVDGDIPASIARDSEVTAAVSAHAADADAHHNWPLLDADIPSTIARDSEVTAAISSHASDANAHHNRSHVITSASDHTVTGAALDVVGLTSTNTLGILTPSAAVSTAVSALLKTDSNGRVQVRGLGVNGAPTGNTLYVGGTSTLATFGDGSGAAVAVINGASAQVRDLRLQSAGVNRWALRVENTAESGSDVGSDFQIFPYSDAGTIKTAAMTISRATGDATFSTNVTVGTALYAGTTSTTAVFGNGSGSAVVNINGAAGQVRDFRFQSGGVNRWLLRANNASESGSGAGTAFEIRPYNDAGTLQSAAISITRADLGVSFGASVSVTGDAAIGGDLTITTNGDQGDRFLMTNSNVSGGTVFYDFNQTDRVAGSTGAFEAGFYRDANNITQFRMSKEVFEIIIKSGGTFRFPLEVRAQQVILAELPTSNPGIVGALYRSGNDVLVST